MEGGVRVTNCKKMHPLYLFWGFAVFFVVPRRSRPSGHCGLLFFFFFEHKKNHTLCGKENIEREVQGEAGGRGEEGGGANVLARDKGEKKKKNPGARSVDLNLVLSMAEVGFVLEY